MNHLKTLLLHVTIKRIRQKCLIEVEGVVFGRLFTFLPPTRGSQLLEQTAIDNRPKPMSSPLNYPA